MYPIDIETVDTIISFCYAAAVVCFAIGFCILFWSGLDPLRWLFALLYAVVTAPFVYVYSLSSAGIVKLGQWFADRLFARHTKQRVADIRAIGQEVRDEMEQLSDEYLNVLAEAQRQATRHPQAKAAPRQSAPSAVVSNPNPFVQASCSQKGEHSHVPSISYRR